MTRLSAPYLTLGIGALAAGAVVALRARQPRRVAVAAAAAAVLCFLLAAWEVAAAGHGALLDPLAAWLKADGLDAVPMAFFSVLTLLVLVLAPRCDAAPRPLAGMLLLAAATQAAYAAANLGMLAAAWWVTGLPFMLRLFGGEPGQRMMQRFLTASNVALTAAVVLLQRVEMDEASRIGGVVFSLMILAVMLRKGVFPVHGWVVGAFERGPLLPLVLLFNGHLGALLTARAQAAALPEAAPPVLAVLSTAALATALITSLRGFAERKPRRLLALLCVSQASFILAGLATGNDQGITGGLLHWLVVAAASTGLVCVVRVLEARASGIADPAGALGLAVKAPRLAAFFLVCSLALVGLPGTLGYCAEDLLFHGALQNHVLLGLALPVATAFNAINVIRLYSILFLGVLPKHVIDIPDALPRERWPLVVCVVFLIAGGLFPASVLRWREQAVHDIGGGLQAPGK